jgi:hypothetical protein
MSVEPEEAPLPEYSDVGRVLVHVLGPGDTGVYRWETKVAYHDGSAFWIHEGLGLDFWFDEIDFPGPGWWVIEGIYGICYYGDGGETDDQEEWYHSEIRPATPEEIANEALT